jgi:AbrB family looped-hinge helix DNA binding protein
MKLPAVNCRISSGIAPKPTRLRSMSYGAVASPFIPAASCRVFWRRRIILTSLIDHVIVIQISIDGGFDMQTVTVSPKYQVVIPKAVREALHLRPGQKIQVLEYDGRIELIPERDIKELRGFLKGINTEFEREKDRV